jgi:methyl-accepting chemotaxis protein
MALVKTSSLGARKRTKPTLAATSATPRQLARRPRKRATTASGLIDEATQELASGLAEAAAACSELQRSMDQISSGAEEAAGAAQESLGLITALTASFRDAREKAVDSRRQIDVFQTAFLEAAMQIETSTSAIELNAARQLGSASLIGGLESAVADIGAIGKVVADMSEQTSMLALNASIEAARAGEDGKGFAVVADEVRILAETSEARAAEMQTLATGISQEVRVIAERVRRAATLADSEAKKGHGLVERIESSRQDLLSLVDGAEEIATAAIQAEGAARETEKSATQVASAAEEQSAAAAEAQQAIEQQTSSLDQSQQTAEALHELTAILDKEDGKGEAVEQVAAAAEQLSATVQELSGAATQILVAVEQIGRGAQIQSAATTQASGAMRQIERSAQIAQQRAQISAQRMGAIGVSVEESRARVSGLVDAVGAALEETRAVLALLTMLGETARKIEKNSDHLQLLAVQTSMLGVSGLVEATRANEAGQGFATVAADIRKLSAEASDSADRAKDSIREVQDQIAVIGRDLYQIVGAAEEEMGRNRGLVERFATVAVDVETMRAASQAIDDAAGIVLISVREILQGAEQIAAAAQQASSAADQAAVAARQQSQVAEDLAAAIEEIASLASALQSKTDA